MISGRLGPGSSTLCRATCAVLRQARRRLPSAEVHGHPLLAELADGGLRGYSCFGERVIWLMNSRSAFLTAKEGGSDGCHSGKWPSITMRAKP